MPKPSKIFITPKKKSVASPFIMSMLLINPAPFQSIAHKVSKISFSLKKKKFARIADYEIRPSISIVFSHWIESNLVLNANWYHLLRARTRVEVKAALR